MNLGLHVYPPSHVFALYKEFFLLYQSSGPSGDRQQKAVISFLGPSHPAMLDFWVLTEFLSLDELSFLLPVCYASNVSKCSPCSSIPAIPRRQFRNSVSFRGGEGGLESSQKVLSALPCPPFCQITTMCFPTGASGGPGAARPSRAQRLHPSGGGEFELGALRLRVFSLQEGRTWRRKVEDLFFPCS